MKIIKEVPVWLIDWVNTIFTLKNDVESIDDIFLDGAIYTSYTLKWNILTLSDAPLVSLFVDYESKVNTISEKISTGITLWDIVSEVYNLTWQTANSTNFNRERIVRMINSISNQIWKWRVINLLNPSQIFSCFALLFSIKDISFRINGTWVLSEKLEINENNAIWDFSNLDLAWFVKVASDLVKYTYNDKKNLSWVEWQSIKYFSWEKLKQVYELPVDFMDIIKIFEPNFYKNYELINYKSKYLIDFSGFSQNEIVSLTYRKKYVNLINDSDLCMLPDNYWIDILANLVAWELLFQRNMPTSQNLLSVWYNFLQTMFLEYEAEKRPIKTSLKAKNRRWKI